MTLASEVYTKTHSFPKGTVMSQFIARYEVNVKHDPVASNIFLHMDSDETITQGDFEFGIVKLPVSEFDITNLSAEEVVKGLDGQGLMPLWAEFAVLLWHLDRDILQPGESALVLTDVIEQAMMGFHMLSIARHGDLRTIDWAPIDGCGGVIKPRYPVQWVIAACKQ